MYELKLAQILVPVSKLYAVMENCSYEGTYSGEQRILPESEVSNTLETFRELEEAKEKAEGLCNFIRLINDDGEEEISVAWGERPVLPKKTDFYEVTEYFIEDSKTGERWPVEKYRYKGRKLYNPEEFKAMKRMLEYLDYYVSLASVLVYERYGLLNKISGNRIRYADENNALVIDSATMEISKDTEYRRPHRSSIPPWEI